VWNVPICILQYLNWIDASKPQENSLISCLYLPRSSYSLQHTDKREKWSRGRATYSSWLAYYACNDRIHNNPDVLVTELAAHVPPLAQAKSSNQGAIAIWAFLTQIGK
jgi:hypothetical protein